MKRHAWTVVVSFVLLAGVPLAARQPPGNLTVVSAGPTGESTASRRPTKSGSCFPSRWSRSGGFRSR